MPDTSAPQPGWYADPENPAAERWWNGSGWSEQQRPTTVAPPAVPASPAAAATPTPATPAPMISPIFPAPLAGDPGSGATGFTFGAAGGGAAGRPDPYAPPPPVAAQPYYGAYNPYGAQPVSSTNGLALAGLLVSCFGWIVVSILGPIVGLILSILGLGQATKREQQGLPNPGRGMAIAGIAVGGGLLGLILLLVIFMFSYAFAAR